MERTSVGLLGAVSLIVAVGSPACGAETPALERPSSVRLAASASGTAPPPVVAGRGVAPLRALLPVSAERTAPSLARILDAPPPDLRPTAGEGLADVEGCAGCHADTAEQWRTSAHAFASFNNPIYRASVDRYRAELGLGPSRFCGGCHDPSLLVDGAMDAPIEPTDARAHAGVTCRTCHGIVATRPDGNGSFDLSLASLPIPKEGDAESVERHKRAAAPAPLRTASLCGTCHRVFLDEASGNPHFVPGQDELTPWARSVYGGSLGERIDEPTEARDCRGCHMAKEDAPLGDVAAKGGRVASHRFLGAHTWLAKMRKDDEQIGRVQRFLEGRVHVDVAAVTTDPLRIAVTVTNDAVGHRFPAGTLDAQDTWLEVHVTDAKGRVLLTAGSEHEGTGDDPSAHRLRALLVDTEGKPVLAREVNHFAAMVFNHTVPPRDVAVVEYEGELPSTVRGPLTARVELRHRTRSRPVVRATCDDAATERARAFVATTRKLTGFALRPCEPPPVLTLARASVELGAGAPTAPATATATPSFRRAYELGLGLTHARQERLEEARAALERARGLAKDAREQAMVEGALAIVGARQNAVPEVEARVARARTLVGSHPALDRVLGDAYANVWRWSDAVAPYEASSDAAPGDDAAAARWALALGSAGEPAKALVAAQRGLRLSPRDADLLRLQGLALRALEAPDANAAEDASLAVRPADRAPGLRLRCSFRVPGCALERDPVHAHTLLPPHEPRPRGH